MRRLFLANVLVYPSFLQVQISDFKKANPGHALFAWPIREGRERLCNYGTETLLLLPRGLVRDSSVLQESRETYIEQVLGHVANLRLQYLPCVSS